MWIGQIMRSAGMGLAGRRHRSSRERALKAIEWIISPSGVYGAVPGRGADYGLRPIPLYAGTS